MKKKKKNAGENFHPCLLLDVHTVTGIQEYIINPLLSTHLNQKNPKPKIQNSKTQSKNPKLKNPKSNPKIQNPKSLNPNQKPKKKKTFPKNHPKISHPSRILPPPPKNLRIAYELIVKLKINVQKKKTKKKTKKKKERKRSKGPDSCWSL